MTLSARAHRDALGVEKIIDWFFWTVFREKNHCEVWWIEEVGRSRATIEWMRRTSTCETCKQLEDINYV